MKDIIALDGKTVRGSKDGTTPPLHLVSAYATSLGLTLGQEGSAGKGNELKAVRALLEALVLNGCIVTLDALGCQTDIAAAIVDKGGDYVLAVKDNQKTLSETLAESFETGETLGWGDVDVQCQTTVEKDHGRLETRRVWLVPRIDWFTLAMLRLDTAYPKSSLRQRRGRASRKPYYREELLGLRLRSSRSTEVPKK